MRKAFEIEALRATLLSASDFFSKAFAFLNGGRAQRDRSEESLYRCSYGCKSQPPESANIEPPDFFYFLADLADFRRKKFFLLFLNGSAAGVKDLPISPG